MAKIKKTREQKILAETRRKQYVIPEGMQTYSVGNTSGPNIQTVNTTSTHRQSSLDIKQFSYLKHDLIHTFFVVIGILCIQAILFFFLNK